MRLPVRLALVTLAFAAPLGAQDSPTAKGDWE